MNPVDQLKAIQGPARHAWWGFWVGVQGWAFQRVMRGAGRGSPSWVLGHVAAKLARLERWTR